MAGFEVTLIGRFCVTPEVRDVLIHGYEGVDLARVWSAASKDLPAVEEALSQILPPLDQLERELAGQDPGE